VVFESAPADTGQDEVLEDAGPPDSGPEMIHFTLAAYASRMNSLEERKNARLAQAIADQDHALRDRLQRELVIMNDKLTLIVDSHEEAVACLRQVVRVLVQLREEPGGPPALADAIDDLRHGNTEPAEACLTTWSGLSRPSAGKIAFSRGLLAECQVDLQQALTMYRQAADLESEEPRYPHAAGRVARMLCNYEEAVRWLELSVRLTVQHDAGDPLALALAQRELAYTYVLAGQHQKAGPLYKESTATMTRQLGPKHHEMAATWFQIGELQEMLGATDKAVVLYKRALAIIEQENGAEHPALAAVLNKLAALYMDLEAESEAIPLYERLVSIREKTLRPNHPQLVVSLNSLSESYRLAGRYSDAESCYLQILAINEAAYGPDHASVAAALQELAKLNTCLDRPEQAQQYQDRAATTFQKAAKNR